MLMLKISDHNSGLIYEKLAICFLKFKLYKILYQRYKSYTGEIDIIAKKNKTIIFIEVKYRKNLNYNYDIVTKRQINRIKRTALLYMVTSKKFSNNKFDMRFDLIIIHSYFLVNHIKNVW